MADAFPASGIRQEPASIDPNSVTWDAPQGPINPADVKWDDAPAPTASRIDPASVQWEDEPGPPSASFEGANSGVNSTAMTPAQASGEVPLPAGWTGQTPPVSQKLGPVSDLIHDHFADAISDSAPVSAALNSEAAKGFAERAHQTSAAAATVMSAPAVLFDDVKSAVTGTPTTDAADAAFRTFVDPNAKAAKENAVAPDASFGGKLAHGIGGLAFDLPAMVATGGEGAAVPLVERGTTALRSGIDALTGAFEHSAKSTLVPGTTNAVDTAQDVLNRGGSGSQASTAAIGSFAADTLVNALPISAAGGLAKRAASGAVAGVAGGKVGEQVRNATRPDDMQQEPTGEGDAMSAIQGAALAAVMGHAAPHDALAGKPLDRETWKPVSEQDQQVTDGAAIQPDHLGDLRAEQPSPQREQVTALAKQHLAELDAQKKLTPAETGMRDFLREHQDNPDVLAEGLGIELEKAPDAAPEPTGNAVTDNLATKLHDHDAAVAEYSAIPETKGGTVLGTDIARELSPEYMADRTKSADTHEPASAFVKKLYADKLTQPTPEGKDPVVLFTAGGTGAGKTTGLKALGDGVKPELIYDTNMNTLDSSRAKIEQALAAGRNVTILYTYRDPAEALRNGALKRAARQEREFGSGRTVPVGEHAKTHTGSFDVVNKLAAEYDGNDRVNILAIDNSGGKGREKIVPLKDIPNPLTEDLHDRLHQQLEEAHASGEISDAVRDGFKAQSSREIEAARRDVRQEPQRGSDEGSPGRSGDAASRGPSHEDGSGVVGRAGADDSPHGAGSESGEVTAPIEPEQTHQTASPTVHLPVAKLKLSDDVPQFKSGAGDNGVVEPLGGTFDDRGTGPIQVWQRKDGTHEVISGRHRLDLARRSGRATIPSQVYKESEGFTARHAAALDAELNIRDGQGKVRDYVNYFKDTGLTKAEAEQRGLLARATGQRAYGLAHEGSPELIAAHRANQITDEAASQIAHAAPGDARLQALGMKAVQEGKSIGVAANIMRAVRAMGGGRESADMFWFDDSAMNEAVKMAGVANKKQRDLSERLAAIQGAAKRPELAAKEGIDVKNPEALPQRIAQLRAERAEWDNWHTHPEMVAKIRDELGFKPTNEHAPADEPSESVTAQDDATAPMFSRATKGEEDGRANEAEAAGQDRGDVRGTSRLDGNRGADTGTAEAGKLDGVRSAVGSTHTVESLRAELHDTSLAGPIAALERSGALRIVHDPANGSGGWWNGKAATLNAAHIPRGEALGVALHELGVHRESDQRAGLRHLIGEAEFTAIGKRLDDLAKGNDSAGELVRAADARVASDDSILPQHRAEERLAYVVEEGANRMRDGTLKGQARALMERIWARLRVAFMRSRLYAAAEKRGVQMKLTPDDMVALAKAAVRRQARSVKADAGRNETLHSRPRTSIIAKDDITAGLTALASHDEAFKLKASSKHSLPDILRDNEQGYRIAHSSDLADDSGAGAENAWAIHTPSGAEARVYKAGKEVWIDVSDLHQGDEGKRIYNAVANWAHNDKLVFIGDPNGLSHIAMKRRTENMLSSALKFGTTDHLHPHDRQEQGSRLTGVSKLRWKVGDTAHNIREMARVTADTTAHEFPEVKDFVYNGESGRFERPDGSEVTDADFDKMYTDRRAQLARSLDPASGGDYRKLAEGNASRLRIALTAGSTSLKRAVLVRSLVRGEGADLSQGGSGVLAGHGAGLAREIAGKPLPDSLKEILYSKPRGIDDGAKLEESEVPLKNIGDALKAAQTMRAVVDPKHMQELGRGDIRSALARRDRRVAQADASVNAFIKYFDRRPKDVREDPRQALADVIRFQRGEQTLDPLTRPFFASVRHLLDSQAAEIRSFGTKYLEHLVENYFPQQWEEPERTHAFYTDAMAKRPLAGGKKFTKERVFNDYEEGIAAGFKPISTNPADLLMGRYQAGEKLLASLRIMKSLEDRGVVRNLEKDERVPIGFARVNDNSFTSKVIPELIAHDLNNYLDPGLTKFAAWRNFRYLENLLLSARLGLSAFHAGMTTLDTIATHADIGWRRMALLGDVRGGLRELARIPTAIYTSPRDGHRLMRQFEGKDKSDANTAAILDALAEGGARGKMNPVDYNDDYRKLMRAIDQGDWKTGAMKAIPGAIEGTTRLIAHYLVPAQKMTARVMHMKFRLDQIADDLGTGRGNYAATLDAMHPDTLKQMSYEINATIDDRLGQFAYDNLFWNKTMKDALHASVQSVGWNFGSLRLILGGMADVRRLAKPEGYIAPLDKAGTITNVKQSRLTDRLSYLITLNAVVAMMGATTQYLMTGHGPKDTKDLFFPRTGRKNDDDTDERIAFPSYVKDEFSWLFHPLTTASHKLHPAFSMISEVAQNKDFYGTQVYDPDASIPTEAKQFLAYLGKSMMPYAIQGAAKNASTGSSIAMTALPFIGITPASGEVTKSHFQEYVAEKYYDTLPSGSRSQEKTDISADFKAAVKAAREGREPDTTGFTPSQLKRLHTESHELVPQIRFKRLPINQQLNAYEKATPEERETYKLRATILHGGYGKISREPAGEQPRLREQMKAVIADGIGQSAGE